jgi:plastocyanin
MNVTRRGLMKSSLVLAVGAPVVAFAQQATPPGGSPAASPAASPEATPGGAISIDIVNFAFEPPSLTVPVGSTVTWVNVSATIHNTVAEDESWQSEILDPGESFSFQMTEPGTYAYLCTIHPNMKAELTVE